MTTIPFKQAVIALVGAAFFWTATTFGSTLLSLDLEKLTQDSDRIVVGRVLDAVSFQRENRIYTLHRIQVSTAVSGGDAEGTVIEVITAGGKIGDIRQAVSGAASLDTGAEYLLFLQDRGDPVFAYVLGMSQGAYTVMHEKGASNATVHPSSNPPRLVSRDKDTGRLVDVAPWLTEGKSLRDVLDRISKILRGSK